MRTSNTQARMFTSTVGKIVMALVFVSLIGGISIAPAFGRDNDRREGYYQQDRYEQRRYKHRRYKHRRHVYQTNRHYYQERVYAPPVVVYDPYPYQSPGINIVVPIPIH
jgi:hypothetical protein